MSWGQAAAGKVISSKAPSPVLGDIWMQRLIGGLISFCRNPSYKQLANYCDRQRALRENVYHRLPQARLWPSPSSNPPRLPGISCCSGRCCRTGWELKDGCGKGGKGVEGGDILSGLSLQESILEARGHHAKELNTSGTAGGAARRA